MIIFYYLFIYFVIIYIYVSCMYYPGLWYSPITNSPSLELLDFPEHLRRCYRRCTFGSKHGEEDEISMNKSEEDALTDSFDQPKHQKLDEESRKIG
jgi:hypothetical protein